MTKKSAKQTSSKIPKKAAKKVAAKKAVKEAATKKLAKIKSTGGFGFSFEDKVAATFFCKMLDGTELLNIPKARLKQVSFQVAAGGWKLDDLLLELKDDLGSLHCAISVKKRCLSHEMGIQERVQC